MKYSLTITDASPSELAALLVSLTGSTAALTPTPVQLGNGGLIMPAAPTDDDESNDAPAAAGTLDKDGLPHDARIHSDPAKLTSKGVWRKRRGVTDNEVATVEAELRSRNNNAAPSMPQPMFDAGTVQPPAPVFTPPQMPVPAMPAPPMLTAAPAVPAMPVTPQMPAPQPVPAPAPQPAAPTDFGAFMSALTTQMSKKDANGAPLIEAPYLATVTAEIATAFNTPLAVITDIAANPQMIGYAIQIFQRDGKWL